MVEIKTDEDAEKFIDDTFKDNPFNSPQRIIIKAIYRNKRPRLDPEIALMETLASLLTLSEKPEGETNIEDSYLARQKALGQECVFVMKHGRLYYGIIKEYDDKVITLQARSASYDATLSFYPQDILLYRTELSTISCERTNDDWL